MTVSDFVGNGGGGLGKRKSVISADFLSSVFDGSIGGGGVGVVVVDLVDLGMMKTGFSGNKMASNLAGDFNAASRLSKFGTSFLTSTTASSVEADVVGGGGGSGGGGDIGTGIVGIITVSSGASKILIGSGLSRPCLSL